MTFIGFASYDSVSHALIDDIAEELQQPRANLLLENLKSFVLLHVCRSAILAAKDSLSITCK